MKKWVPNDNPGDFVALSGYINVEGIVQAIQQCGDDLTRENLLKQATGMKGTRFKMMLPGIQLNTTPQDYAPYESLRMAKFEGSSWKLIDEAGGWASAKWRDVVGQSVRSHCSILQERRSVRLIGEITTNLI